MKQFKIQLAKILYKIIVWLCKHEPEILIVLDKMDDGEINESMKEE